MSVGETAAYGVYDASDGALPTIDGGDLGSIAITDWGSGVAKAIIIVNSVGDSQAILSKDLTQHSSLPASSGVVSIIRWDENGNKITGTPSRPNPDTQVEGLMPHGAPTHGKKMLARILQPPKHRGADCHVLFLAVLWT